MINLYSIGGGRERKKINVYVYICVYYYNSVTVLNRHNPTGLFSFVLPT